MTTAALTTRPAPALAPPIAATIFEGVCARVHERPGDPLRYTNQDGSVRSEYRNLANLRKLADGLAGRPLRREHDPTRTIGKVLACRVEDGRAIATVAVTDATALADIRSGVAELSCGYGAHIDAQGYQQIDSVEELSVVRRARCGPSCALRTDADRLADERALAARLRRDLAREWSRVDCACGCGFCGDEGGAVLASETEVAARNRADLASRWRAR